MSLAGNRVLEYQLELGFFLANNPTKGRYSHAVLLEKVWRCSKRVG
jgi:hypothetical protein